MYCEQKMIFQCTCGFEQDIETHLAILEHISICNEFKFVNTYPLENLNIQQLLTFRADLTLQLQKVDLALLKKEYITPTEGSLKEYAKFTSSKKSTDIYMTRQLNGKRQPESKTQELYEEVQSLVQENSKASETLLNQKKPQVDIPRKQLASDHPKYDFQSSQYKIQEDPDPFDPAQWVDLQKENLIPCESCKKKYSPISDTLKIWYLETCTHLICKECLSQLILKEYILKDGKVECPEFACKCLLTYYDIACIVGQDKALDLESLLIRKQNNIVSCVKCKSDFFVEVGNESDLIKDKLGKTLTGELLECFTQNRYVCQTCNTEQCRTCACSPFHLGLTCADYASNKQLKQCRLCENPVQYIDSTLPEAIQNICQQEDCQARSKLFCLKKTKCGHFCCGVKDELECLPCLNVQCVKESINQTQSEDDYCNICFTEALKSAPCIRSLCGHVYHDECVRKILQTRWNGPRINFNFCKCVLCKKSLQFHKQHHEINKLLAKNQETQKLIIEQSRDRLKIEGKANDKELTDPKSQYFNQPDEYALAVFCFYECFKCRTPYKDFKKFYRYFGGIKNCQANLDNDRRNFKQEDLICPQCCPITFEKKCPKHGTQFIEFKCRFCCSLALWFCGGSTHYCDPCHSGAGNPNMNQPCKGPEYCPLGIAHAPNGNECALGCAMCRGVKNIIKKK